MSNIVKWTNRPQSKWAVIPERMFHDEFPAAMGATVEDDRDLLMSTGVDIMVEYLESFTKDDPDGLVVVEHYPGFERYEQDSWDRTFNGILGEL